MRILLIYPEYPDTFWGLKHALRFISKKATHPPLGLLTVAAMLPKEWEKKLIDMNIESLRDKELELADLVFVSGISIARFAILFLTIVITMPSAQNRSNVASR